MYSVINSVVIKFGQIKDIGSESGIGLYYQALLLWVNSGSYGISPFKTKSLMCMLNYEIYGISLEQYVFHG